VLKVAIFAFRNTDQHGGGYDKEAVKITDAFFHHLGTHQRRNKAERRTRSRSFSFIRVICA